VPRDCKYVARLTADLTEFIGLFDAADTCAIAKKVGLVRDFCHDLLEDDDLRESHQEIHRVYSGSFGLQDDIKLWKSCGDQERGVVLGLAPEGQRFEFLIRL
jgi:hypothetical protein